MELMSLAKEALQTVAEHVASYRLGQTTLRYLDRALWTVEKCARWAVPPPLDQDERPQPELVRPLPWVFFLALLVALRVTRESISLVNLVLGKPPLRSADVVTYIQSKRRYLRTLKYQGNRMMRARTEPTAEPWYTSLQTLFEFTMCFRRPDHRYSNNNTTHLSNNDEVLVVKRRKSGGHDVSPVATSETTMERLIEKIMVDLDADSDEDSIYTLTNVTSIRSDQSEYNSESEQDTAMQIDSSTPNNSVVHDETPEEDSKRNVATNAVDHDETPEEDSEQNITANAVIHDETPEEDSEQNVTTNAAVHNETPEEDSEQNVTTSAAVHDETPEEDSEQNVTTSENNIASFTNDTNTDVIATSTPEKNKSDALIDTNNVISSEAPNAHGEENGNASGMVPSYKFIQNEKSENRFPQKCQETPKKQKIANGRANTSPQNEERITSGDGGY